MFLLYVLCVICTHILYVAPCPRKKNVSILCITLTNFNIVRLFLAGVIAEYFSNISTSLVDERIYKQRPTLVGLNHLGYKIDRFGSAACCDCWRLT